MSNKVLKSELIISAQDKTAAGLASAAKRIDGAVKSVERFRRAQEKFAATRTAFQSAQKAVEQAARAMKSAERPTRQLTAAYNQAQAAVVRASKAFQEQKAVLLSAKSELSGAGISVARLASEETRLKTATNEVSAAMERQATRAAKLQRLRQAGGLAGGIAGLYIAHEASRGARLSLETYREFDKERRYAKAVMGLTDEEQRPLVQQAIRGGGATKYNDIQWLEAQRDLAARGLNASQILGIMPSAANLGQALALDLPDAVKQLEGAMFGFKRDTSTLQAAQASALHTADLQTKAAKISGMSPEDLTEVYKYGAAPARLSGVSEETLLAFGGILKRANIGGDQAGVAFRAMIAAAQSPTRQAREAMLARGLDYKNYQRNPDRLALDPFIKDVAAQYGVKLNASTRGGLDKIFSDKNLISDPALFAPAVTALLRGSLGGTDAKSLRSIAGAANRYRNVSMTGVDVNALIKDLLTKMAGNLQFANVFFGPKQGGRIATALGDPETFARLLDQLENHSSGYAANIAEERMAGFDGAVSRLEGSLKNVETAIGRSWDQGKNGGPITFWTNAAGGLAQRFAELDASAVQLVSGLTAAAAAGIGVRSALGIASWGTKWPLLAGIGGFLGPAVAAGGAVYTAWQTAGDAVVNNTGLSDTAKQAILSTALDPTGTAASWLLRDEKPTALTGEAKVTVHLVIDQDGIMHAEVGGIDNTIPGVKVGTTGSVGRSWDDIGPVPGL
jgi:TP901 family phage tail tape measure protein